MDAPSENKSPNRDSRRVRIRTVWFGAALFLVALAVVVLFATRDALAEFAWQKRLPRTALFLVQRDVPLAMRLGAYYFGNGAYDSHSARVAYGKAVAADPSVLWGHYQLARIDFVDGDLPRAREEIDEELAAHPDNLRSFYVRGLIDGNAGNLEDAENDFRKFIAWEPKEWAGYNDLAWILSLEGKYRDMQTTMQKAMVNVLSAETNPWLWNSEGVAELNLGELTAAGNSFENALRFANALTARDWQNAYPGNDPASSASGLSAFKANIESNLHLVVVDKSL